MDEPRKSTAVIYDPGRVFRYSIPYPSLLNTRCGKHNSSNLLEGSRRGAQRKTDLRPGTSPCLLSIAIYLVSVEGGAVIYLVALNQRISSADTRAFIKYKCRASSGALDPDCRAGRQKTGD